MLVGNAAALAAVFGALAAHGAFVIAERGKPADCAIVTKGTGPSLDYAATELRDFTERMTGVRLAVNPAVRPARTVELELADVAEASRPKVNARSESKRT